MNGLFFYEFFLKNPVLTKIFFVYSELFPCYTTCSAGALRHLFLLLHVVQFAQHVLVLG